MKSLKSIAAAAVLALALVACKGDPHTGMVIGKYEPTTNEPDCWRISLQLEPTDPNKKIEDHKRGTWCVLEVEWKNAQIGQQVSVTEQ